NPNVATGRRALAEQIAKNVKRQAVQARIKAPVVSIVAEGNLVVVSLVSEIPDPADSSKTYTTTWFDMFRIENGKIVEHWDSALKLP
ncbi:MAG: nuclear transport factor 2 family protein, partial [Dechloromonas agitata]|nr:nuclear transport factor 2 family protein [Dechloromonas agitata]